ncbi:MAG: PAS domain-containing protein [Planctomycetota bacterium]|nr:MAG: PAS domain-containing protein [Planctomycetota bacterium]
MHWTVGLLLGLIAGALVAALIRRRNVRRLAQTLRRLGDSGERGVDGSDGRPFHPAIESSIQALARRMGRLQSRLDALQERSDLLVAVLRTMMEGVVVLDQRQRVLFANDAARRLLELPPQRTTGTLLLELVRSPAIEQAIARVLEEQRPVSDVEFEMPRSKKRLLLQLAPLTGNPPQGMLLVFHDVTELRRLERIRREFVSNVSHELKTPLTSIEAYAETLLEGALEDSAHNRRFVERIASEAERLHALIRDLLELHRIESRPSETIEHEPVDLAQAVRDCVARHMAVAERKRIHLQAHAEPTATQPEADARAAASEDRPAYVLANPSELRTLLDNLVDNALKYTPPGGRVAIHLAGSRSHIEIRVQDTGCGIPEEHLPRIFERFYRVDRARSFDEGSTGLGLAIVKHIVQSCGGSIDVRSTVGEGTTFTVRLPRADQGAGEVPSDCDAAERA